MTVSFPAALPMPTQDYSLDVAHSNARTEMESGRTRQRRRFSNSAQSISIIWDFTDAEFQLFESWAMHRLDGANNWFETDLLTGGGVVSHKVRIQNGQYSATYQNHMRWKVTATLDVEAINRIEPEVLMIMLDIDTDFDSMSLMLSALEQTVNFNDLRDTA